MLQAKRTKNILKKHFFLSEKRFKMNTNDHESDQAFNESALTPLPVLNTRVVIDAADRDPR